MPDIPEFEGRSEVSPAQMPEMPGMGGIGAAISQAAGRVEEPLQEFNRKYQEARRSSDAVARNAVYTGRQGEAEHDASLIPDHMKALATFDKSTATMRDEINGLDLDFREKTQLLNDFNGEAAMRRVAVGRQAFEREASAHNADTVTTVTNLQMARAEARGNPALQAKIDQQAMDAIDANVNGGWGDAKAGAEMKLRFKSQGIADDITAEANSYRIKGDTDALDALTAKVDDTKNYPGMLPEERAALSSKLISWSWKLEGRVRAAENRAQAEELARLKEKLFYAQNGMPDPTGGLPTGKALADTASKINPDNPDPIIDGVNAVQINNWATNATRHTSAAEDEALLFKLQKGTGTGAVPPELVAKDPKLAMVQLKYNKQLYDMTKATIEAKQRQLKVDPANYVLSNYDDVRAAFEAAGGEPAKLRHAFDLMDATLKQLGVAPGNRQIITDQMASSYAAGMVADPASVGGKVTAWRHIWGSDYYNRVMDAIVKKGHLPVPYQSIADMSDPNAGGLLAKFVGNAKPGADGMLHLGQGMIAKVDQDAMRDGIINDDGIKQWRQSLLDSGMSPTKVQEHVDSVVMLAEARLLYNKEDSAAAATAAVADFTGGFHFVSQDQVAGSAYAPTAQYDATLAAAQHAMATLDLANVKIPNNRIFGTAPGQRPPADYVKEIKEGNYSVINAPNREGWWFKDHAGTVIRDKQGHPIYVPFGGAGGPQQPLPLPVGGVAPGGMFERRP